ncbi:MAG: hypothetical protein HY791_08670 [Deltaproteobacteria bacterium]|nr:hypothetical protein [Deltaproteobacteria bacterium]
MNATRAGGRISLVFKWTAVVFSAWSSTAEAHPADQYGLGARSVAMGGAMTSAADDFSAAYYNPALLAHPGRLRLELGYAASLPDLRINDRSVDVDASHGFLGGVSIGGEILGHALGFSLGLALPDELISRVRTRRESQPRFVLYDNLPQRLVVSTSLGVELLEGFAIGAGLTYIASTKGTLGVAGEVSASRAELTRLVSEVDVTFSSVRTPAFGLSYSAGPLSFGITYRDEFVLELDLDVRVTGDVTLGDERLILVENGSFLLDSFNTDLFSPRQIAVGASFREGGWLLAVDLTWAQYSRFVAPVSRLDLQLDLGELDFEVPLPDPPVDPEFSDIFIPRVGVEGELVRSEEWALLGRMGYAYQPSPVPSQTGKTNYLDGTKHVVSIGVGVETNSLSAVLPQPMSVDVSAAIIVLAPKAIEKANAADAVGDYRSGGRVWTVAAMARFPF